MAFRGKVGLIQRNSGITCPLPKTCEAEENSIYEKLNSLAS